MTYGRLTVPDVETALVGYLVDAGALGGNISTELARDLETRLAAGEVIGRLHRAPGSTFVDQDTGRLEAIRLQLETYGRTGVFAFAAMAELVSVLAGAVDADLTDVVITSVRIPNGPQWAPDPDTDHPRYLAFAIVHAHARDTGS